MLAANLGKEAFKQWGIFIGIVTLVYLLYSGPNMVIQQRDRQECAPPVLCEVIGEPIK